MMVSLTTHIYVTRPQWVNQPVPFYWSLWSGMSMTIYYFSLPCASKWTVFMTMWIWLCVITLTSFHFTNVPSNGIGLLLQYQYWHKQIIKPLFYYACLNIWVMPYWLDIHSRNIGINSIWLWVCCTSVTAKANVDFLNSLAIKLVIKLKSFYSAVLL